MKYDNGVKTSDGLSSKEKMHLERGFKFGEKNVENILIGVGDKIQATKQKTLSEKLSLPLLNRGLVLFSRINNWTELKLHKLKIKLIYKDVLKFISATDYITTEKLQREFNIGYSTSVNIINKLKQDGFIYMKENSRQRVMYAVAEK